MSSYKPEVQVGEDPKWYDNALRFATREEAQRSADDLMGRWLLVTARRATESPDPVNWRLDDTGLHHVLADAT